MKTSKARQPKHYAIYKGDDFIIWGTAEHIANRLNVRKETVSWWAQPANLRRNAKHGGRTIAVVIEEDEHE